MTLPNFIGEGKSSPLSTGVGDHQDQFLKMGPGGSAVHFCSPFSLQSTPACLWMVNLQYNASARFPQVHTGSFRFTQVHTGSFRSGLLGIRTLLGGRITLSIGRAGVICATGVHTADIPTTGLRVWV